VWLHSALRLQTSVVQLYWQCTVECVGSTSMGTAASGNTSDTTDGMIIDSTVLSDNDALTHSPIVFIGE
jgi:hypothetical protein